MRAIIVDDLWINFDNITTYEEDILWVEFSAAPPSRGYVDPAQFGPWDGVFRRYNRVKRRIPRPLLEMLRAVCIKRGLALEVKDARGPSTYQPAPPDAITSEYLPGITLDAHQIQAIQIACGTDPDSECGIFHIPTGGGKTECIAGICKAMACPTVIVASMTVAIDQLVSRLQLREVASEIGYFYAGARPNGELIVIGTIQSLAPPKKLRDAPTQKPDESPSKWHRRWSTYMSQVAAHRTRTKNVGILQQYVRDANMIIVDECDLASGDTYKYLFRYLFNGRRRYGFSGTPYDSAKPVEWLVVQSHLGSILMEESRENLEAIGRISPATYTMLVVGEHGNYREKSAYDIAYDEHLAYNPTFHKLIAGICKKYPQDGTLVLVEREQLGLHLIQALADVGIVSEFIHGKTSKRKRDAALRAFEERQTKVLVGGKIINRALDLRGGCENLIIATGGKMQSGFLQQVGRALRLNERGTSRIFDFYFRCNAYLYAHSRARLNTMIGAGYKTSVVFYKGVVDGADLQRSRFRIPARLR